MNLTNENYFTLEAENAYMSNHLWGDFMKCEARTIACLDGKYEKPDKKPGKDVLIAGHVMEAVIQGRDYKDIPGIYQKDCKTLYADYLQAVNMGKRAMRDPLFCKVTAGAKQEIYTGEIGGLPWKCKTDDVNHEKRVICDIKSTADFDDDWKEIEGKNKKVPWYWVYDYPRQLATQRELVRQNTGENYFCLLAAVTKQDPPDIRIIEVSLEKDFALELMGIESKSLRIKEVFQRREKPTSCGVCDYCRKVKVLTGFEQALSIYG